MPLVRPHVGVEVAKAMLQHFEAVDRVTPAGQDTQAEFLVEVGGHLYQVEIRGIVARLLK